MNLQKFTVKAQEAVQKATEIAASANHQGVEPPHLLKAFLGDPGSIVASIVGRLGANADYLGTKADEAMAKLPVVTGASVSGQYVGEALKKVFDRALAEAELLGDEYVSSEHLLVGLAESKGDVGQAMRDQGLSKEAILNVLKDVRGSQRATDQYAESRYEALKRYARDLNELAPQGEGRSRHRAGRGDPPRLADPLAPHQEQPRPRRRAGRGQDGHRRRPRHPHRPGRRPREPQE